MMQAQLYAPMLAADGAFSVSMLQHFVRDGGWITWFVLIPLSVVMLSLIVHYAIVIRRSAHVPVMLGRSLLSAARQGQYRHVVEMARESPTMLGQAAYAGVAQLRSGRDSARVAVEEVVDERATKLLRRIEYLHVIGNVSPMIGLFGTVLGMIMAFSRIAEAGGGMPEPGQLAGDISVALVTTFWGILIAIPSLTMHAVFRNKVDAFAAECVKQCEDLLSAISQQVSRGGTRNASARAATSNAAEAKRAREDEAFSASVNEE